MNKMEEFFKKISEVKAKYDRERHKDRFNIITALHKERDEKNLHSRFISYLLSPTSGHDMGAVYLKLFISDVLKIEGFDISSITVLPNEANKSEYENIDILIVNDNNQAIIIENKIGAQDSNQPNYIKDGYKGQLERYYNTVKKGENNEDKDCSKYQRDNVFVYYLSDGKAPSEVSIGMLKDEDKSWNESHNLSYDEHIRAWLGNCINITSNDKVKMLIDHYLKLINKMTNNDLSKEESIVLKNTVAENIESVKYLLDNFKHVKWHATHEFWTELKEQLLENSYQNVILYPEGKEFNKVITDITHKNKDVNHGVLFDLKNGYRAYISGEGNLSWGVMSPKKWKWFKNPTINEVNFSSFNSKYTYLLIDRDRMVSTAKEIIAEIAEEEENKLINLKLAL